MSASNQSSKIDLLDDREVVYKKINKADCIAGNPDNGLMAFLKHVLMIIKGDNNDKFIVERPEKYGGDLEYKNYEEIERDFVKKKLHPLDLKNAIAKEISNLLGKIDRMKLEKLSKKAYEEEY